MSKNIHIDELLTAERVDEAILKKIKLGIGLRGGEKLGKLPSLMERIKIGGLKVVGDDYPGDSPLQKAISRNSLKLVDFLLNEMKVDVNEQGANFKTALFLAMEERNETQLMILDLLLEANVDLEVKNGKGRTALQEAVAGDQIEKVKKLISAGAEVNTKKGQSPLSIASKNGNMDLVNILLTAGAHVNHVEKKGKTPLMAAFRSEKKDVVEKLLKSGADIDAKTASGKTVLDLPAAGSLKHLVVSYKEEREFQKEVNSEQAKKVKKRL